jgi:quinol monooxygenase YgiN
MPEVMVCRHDLRHMCFPARPARIVVKEFRMKHTSRVIREVLIVAALAFVVFSPGVIALSAQGLPQGFPDLAAALRNTPGCLGVEAARTATGKQVLFAWFENKQAVLNWFYSDTHQKAMQMFTPGASTGRKPLADIPDGSGPILAIASITFVDKPQVEGVQLPVSQIAIELYAPLPGGLAAGGRFAPSTVKVPGLLEAGAK